MIISDFSYVWYACGCIYELQFGENCMAKNGWFGIYRSETAKMAKIETFPDISQNEEIRSSWFSELGTQIVSLKNSVMISSIIPDFIELILAAWLFVCLQIQFCRMLSLKFVDPELGVTSIPKLSQITGKDRLGVRGFYIRELSP